MLCVSLLCWVAPVSADVLEWKDEDPPEEFEAVDIEDLAVSEGGAPSNRTLQCRVATRVTGCRGGPDRCAYG